MNMYTATADVLRGAGTTSITTASVMPTHISPVNHKCTTCHLWISTNFNFNALQISWKAVRLICYWCLVLSTDYSAEQDNSLAAESAGAKTAIGTWYQLSNYQCLTETQQRPIIIQSSMKHTIQLKKKNRNVQHTYQLHKLVWGWWMLLVDWNTVLQPQMVQQPSDSTAYNTFMNSY